MGQANLRARILAYLERAVTGDLLRSERDIANAVSATVEEVHETVRDLVKRGEVFEPIPRRYLRRERRIGERRAGVERRVAPRLRASERRRKARRSSKR
jgi:DNA-binding Lrp family transcriptional regulator